MVKKGHGPSMKALWAYAYDVTFPEGDDRRRKIQEALDQGHSEARDGERTWAGRVMVEPQITRILVISDSPTQDRDANRRLEAELKLLEATFEMTVAVAVVADDAPPSSNGRPLPN